MSIECTIYMNLKKWQPYSLFDSIFMGLRLAFPCFVSGSPENRLENNDFIIFKTNDIAERSVICKVVCDMEFSGVLVVIPIYNVIIKEVLNIEYVDKFPFRIRLMSVFV